MNKIVFSGLEEYSPEDLFRRLPSPSYVIDETQLECNGFCLLAVAERTGCKVLLAQKAFSNYNFYPLLEPYLAGTEGKSMSSVQLTGKMNLMSFLSMQTILCSIRRGS